MILSAFISSSQRVTTNNSKIQQSLIITLFHLLLVTRTNQSFQEKEISLLKYQSINGINNQTQGTIIGADNYINLYLWKDLNVSSVYDLVSVKGSLRLFSMILE